MKRKLIAATLISTGLLLGACQKDVDKFIPDPGQSIGPDTAWYDNISIDMPVNQLRAALLKPAGTDTIEVNSLMDSISLGASGVCRFPPFSCVTAGGAAVTGKVVVEWNLIKSKGDMIRMNRANSSYNRVLINGSEIFIALKKDGQLLQLAPGIQLSIDILEANNTASMSFFAGTELPSGFTWQPNPDVLNNTVSPVPGAYRVATNRLGWTSYGYFFDTTGLVRSRVRTALPANYTNANTIIFTSFDNQASVIGMLPDVTSKKFASPLLPDGKPVSVITISKQEDDYYFAKTPLLIDGQGTGSQVVPIVPMKKTLPEIFALLSAL